MHDLYRFVLYRGNNKLYSSWDVEIYGHHSTHEWQFYYLF